MFAAEVGNCCGIVEEVAWEGLGDAGDGEGEGWGWGGGGGHGWVGGLEVGED